MTHFADDLGDLQPGPSRGADVALVVVDMQEYFCRDDSAFSRGFAAAMPEEVAWYHHHLTAEVIPTIRSVRIGVELWGVAWMAAVVGVLPEEPAADRAPSSA